MKNTILKSLESMSRRTQLNIGLHIDKLYELGDETEINSSIKELLKSGEITEYDGYFGKLYQLTVKRVRK